MKIIINKKADKELLKIFQGNKNYGFKIQAFINEVLSNSENPIALPNAKKLQGLKNHYRWRVGDYRIIGVVENKILTIEIIKIAHRQEAYE